MGSLPLCPVCGSSTAVRETTWVGAPMLVCDDCARGGRGADAYFDPPKVCSTCGGSRLISVGSQDFTQLDIKTTACPACAQPEGAA